MFAKKVKGTITVDNRLIAKIPEDIPAGNVEVIFMYEKKEEKKSARPKPLEWPSWQYGMKLTETWNRKELYDDLES